MLNEVNTGERFIKLRLRIRANSKLKILDILFGSTGVNYYCKNCKEVNFCTLEQHKTVHR